MSEAELRAEARMLSILQKQYDEALTNAGNNAVMIQLLGTSNNQNPCKPSDKSYFKGFGNGKIRFNEQK